MSKAAAFRCFAASFALFFVLNEFAFADDPEARVVSNRFQTGNVNWLATDVPGPVLIDIPGFGELFVAECRVGEPGQEFSPPRFGFRNKSPGAIDFLAVTDSRVIRLDPQPNPLPGEEIIAVQPDQQVFLLDLSAAVQASVIRHVFELGRNRRVAILVATAVNDGHATCRFQAQATVDR